MTTATSILAAIEAIRITPDQVIEVRALGVKTRGRAMTASGYFNDHEKLAKAAEKYDERGAEGIYVTLNPVNPDLLSRSANRMMDWAKDTTGDGEIVQRVWLPIDIDPVRPRGISSSDYQLKQAEAVRDAVSERMQKWFSVDPTIVGCSGNGWHLLYRIDLPADKALDPLIRTVLEQLQKAEGTAETKIDSAVFNAARIWKLYGTTARKGDDTPERPHRRAEIVAQYESPVIPEKLLASFEAAHRAAKPATKASTKRGIAESADTLSAYLATRGVGVKQQRPGVSGAVVLILDGCPMTPDHGNGTDTAVIWRPDGIGFECKHDRCSAFTWKDLRTKIDPDHGEAPETPQLREWTPNLSTGSATTTTQTPPAEEERPPIVRVANFYTESGAEDEKTVYAVPIETITANLAEATGGWPRRVSGVLFVRQRDGIRTLSNTDELFSWMQLDASYHWQVLRGKKTARDPRTKASCSLVTRPEFYEHLKAQATPNYSGYEKLPHHPLVDDIFYIPKQLPTGGVDCLREFLAHLNADTPEDKALMMAALMTPGWGGPCGARPAFLFQSKFGRGVGKSTTAQLMMGIWGGWISISAEGDWKEAKQRMLDDTALGVRCVYIDNIRNRLQGTDIESLITSPVIDGKRMYYGQFSRPNRLTFFLTSNTPRLSQDLADRCIPINVGSPKHGTDFEKWAHRWIPENKDQLLADIFLAMQSGPQCEISKENRSRWFAWECDILSKFPNGDALAALVKERRPEADADRDDADDVAYAINKEIALMDPDWLQKARLNITNDNLFKLLKKHELTDDRFGKRKTIHWLTNLAGSGPLAFLHRNPSRRDGRSWLIGDPNLPVEQFTPVIV